MPSRFDNLSDKDCTQLLEENHDGYIQMMATSLTHEHNEKDAGVMTMNVLYKMAILRQTIEKLTNEINEQINKLQDVWYAVERYEKYREDCRKVDIHDACSRLGDK